MKDGVSSELSFPSEWSLPLLFPSSPQSIAFISALKRVLPSHIEGREALAVHS